MSEFNGLPAEFPTQRNREFANAYQGIVFRGTGKFNQQINRRGSRWRSGGPILPNGRHDDQVDALSQALGHKSRSYWTNASLDGYSNLMKALYQDAVFGRLAGRPW